MGEDTTIPKEECEKAVEGALARLALLHISFSKTLINEFGEEKGKDLTAKAIIDYGKRITERVQKGLPDLPMLGLYDEAGQNEKEQHFVRGCTLAKVFKEQDALDVGYLYCYVDAAKYMAMDTDTKLIHLTCEACGDNDCTFDMLPTTEEDRKSYSKRTGEWRKVDPRLHDY